MPVGAPCPNYPNCDCEDCTFPEPPAAKTRAYRAVVKYPIDATRDDKVRALHEGLDMVAMELVGEHGVALDVVEQWLEDAAMSAAEEAEALETR